MADEKYRWLDREAAERLLSGESLETVDMADRDRAEKLAETLDALSVDTSPTRAELPGEAAALAAFRRVRAARAENLAEQPGEERPGARPGGRTRFTERARSAPSDIGLVRIGGPGGDDPRPRRGRTIRLGPAAALAVVGSVVVAVGIGVLPAVFGEADPAPGTSAAAPATADRPHISPSPDPSQHESSPGGSTGGSGSGHGASRDTAREGHDPAPETSAGSDGRTGRPGNAWTGTLSACRDIRDGRVLTPGRKHALEGAAGGASQVRKYCKAMLADRRSAHNDGENRTEKDREGRTKKAHGGDKDDDGHRDGRGHRGRGAHGAGCRGGEHGAGGLHWCSGGDRHHPDGGTRTRTG